MTAVWAGVFLAVAVTAVPSAWAGEAIHRQAREAASLQASDAIGRPPGMALAAPSEILVVGRPVSAASGKRSRSPSFLAPAAEDAVRELARRHRVIVREARRLGAGRAFARAFPGGAWVLRTEGKEDPAAMAARLREDPAVLYAGLNHLLVLAARQEGQEADEGKTVSDSAPATQPQSAGTETKGTGDPLFSEQDALAAVRAPQAWQRTRGAGVLVAVIDTGMDLTHPDLVDRIEVNAAERDGQSGVDDDGNGYVDDVLGYDFTDAPGTPGAGDYRDRDPDPSDDLGHGTEVAGVLAATRNNGIGIAGVAPEAKLLAVRAGFRTELPLAPGFLEEDDAAVAILYAVDRGAKILNLSWGDVVDAPLVRAAIRYARLRGALVVAAAGNEPGDLPFYPASAPAVLAAGASGEDGNRAAFSTYGQDLDLLAPGVGLLTTTLDGRYERYSGTSFSAPMTAGTAALVWSLFPQWTADQVAWRLRFSASAASGGWSPERGWGILDAAAAVGDETVPPVVQVGEIREKEGSPERDTTVSRTDMSGPTAKQSTAPAQGANPRERVFVGTVAATGLSDWTLSVLPEAMARAEREAAARATGQTMPAGDFPGEIVLAERMDRQAVAESLAAFSPAPADTGLWVARLRAWVDGYPLIEKRTRFRLPPAMMDLDSLKVELQVGSPQRDAPDSAGGWDVVATWRSRAAYVGALRLDEATAWPIRKEEKSEGTHHALRLRGPLPVGTHRVEMLARSVGAAAFTPLASSRIELPPAASRFHAEALPQPPPGTPMSRAQDWDDDGRSEVFVESPPGAGGSYGVIRRYEVDSSAPSAAPIEAGSSEGLYTGIPVDATVEPDRRVLLVVYRTDGWSVWESREPGGFPDRLLFTGPEGDSVPVRCLWGGAVFLVVSAQGLTVYTRDETLGFHVASQASVPGSRLSASGAVADFNDDGVLDVFFPDLGGGLVRFAVEGTTARAVGKVPLGGVQIVSMAAVTAGWSGAQVPTANEDAGIAPTAGAHRPTMLDLITAEVDPPSPQVEGDLERAAVRVRRWKVTGDDLEPRGALAFAGLLPGRRVRLVSRGWRPLLLRGTRLDVLDATGDSLQWGGGLPPWSEPDRVDGVVVLPANEPLATVLWVGTSAGGTAGKRLLLVPLSEPSPPVIGAVPPLRVIEARVSGGDSLRLALAWDEAGCGLPEEVKRIGPGETGADLLVEGRKARDAISLGARVTYRLTALGCVDRETTVQALSPQGVVPVWTGPHELAIRLAVPLVQGPARVLLRRGGDLVAPEAVFVDRGGGRILLAIPSGVAPDSVIVEGAWDAHGLPLGGSVRAAGAVSAPPAPVSPPVLARVAYEASPAPAHLAVSLGGGEIPDSCTAPFHLEPRGWDLGPGRQIAPGERILDLPKGLSPGRYRLRLNGACLRMADSAPGLERAFTVGAVFYPNPMRPGQALTVAGASPGGRVRILDVSGREREAWRVTEATERHRLPGLPPGLYFLRLQGPQGNLVLLRKLVILR